MGPNYDESVDELIHANLIVLSILCGVVGLNALGLTILAMDIIYWICLWWIKNWPPEEWDD